jgi:restriction system protein
MIAAMGVLLVTTGNSKSPDLLSPALKGFFHAALAIWPLWLLIGLVALGKLAYQLYRLRRLSKSGIREIDGMDGKTFEAFLGTLFRRLGYSVEITRYRGDYGADLVVTNGRKRTAVQAKRWSKRVGLKAVQEAVAAKGYYGCEAALVVATREFTQPARRLARANKVELWDREELVKKLLAVRGEAEAPELAPQMVLKLATASPVLGAPRDSASSAPLAQPREPTVALIVEPVIVEPARCVICDVPVSDKVRDYCVAHSARFGGNIYCFTHQRAYPAAPSSVQPEQVVEALRIANEGRPTEEGKRA